MTTAVQQHGSEVEPLNGAFRIARDGTEGNLTVFYSLDTSQSTASEGSDFFTLSGNVVIPDGFSYADISIVTIDDEAFEGLETVVVNLESSEGYTIGSPDTGSLTIYDDDAYPVYVDAVDQASNSLETAVTSALAAYEADVDGAYSALESVANDADAAYLAAAASAENAYDSDTSSASASYMAASDAAWSNQLSADAQAEDDYEAALDAANTAYESAGSQAEDDYDSAIADADTAYANAIAPYQQARDEAYAAYLADPENPELESAWLEAEDDLGDAIDSASAERDTSYAAVLSTLQAAQASASADLDAAEDAAMSSYEAAIAANDASRVSAQDAAWADYLSAEETAWNALTQAMDEAWSTYENSFADAIDAYEAALNDAVTEFDSNKTEAEAAWASAEAAAWNAYLGALAPNEQPGERIEQPPVNGPGDPPAAPEMLAQAPPPDRRIVRVTCNYTGGLTYQQTDRILVTIGGTPAGTRVVLKLDGTQGATVSRYFTVPTGGTERDAEGANPMITGSDGTIRVWIPVSALLPGFHHFVAGRRAANGSITNPPQPSSGGPTFRVAS